MDDVRVHYNSPKPATVQAHAYAQGNQIHLAPGQERHLPHEAWHVVQQKQGRVKPTAQFRSNVNINDDEYLEREADVMGARALQMRSAESGNWLLTQKNDAGFSQASPPPVQRVLYYASNSDRHFEDEDELRTFFDGANEKLVTFGALNTARQSEDYFYVDYYGSIAGRHGYEIRSIEPYSARPAVADRGNAVIDADDGAAGFKISGRPGWTAETLAKLQPVKHRENIRHIIPYHMIRDGYMAWVNLLFTQTGGNLLGVLTGLSFLAKKVGMDELVVPGEHKIETVHEWAIMILGHLNNIPGNLWAGEKKENQRLNTLRQRIDGIKDQIQAHDHPGTKAREMLTESIDGSHDPVYKGILEGAREHFPEDEAESNAMLLVRVNEILERLRLAGEIDAMPSTKELDRLDEDTVEIMMQNMPDHFKVLELFQSSKNLEAMVALSKLADPYAEEEDDSD